VQVCPGLLRLSFLSHSSTRIWPPKTVLFLPSLDLGKAVGSICLLCVERILERLKNVAQYGSPISTIGRLFGTSSDRIESGIKVQATWIGAVTSWRPLAFNWIELQTGQGFSGWIVLQIQNNLREACPIYFFFSLDEKILRTRLSFLRLKGP